MNHIPINLNFVRHGQSQFNILVEGVAEGIVKNDVFEEHDSSVSLTPKGVEQAIKAGEFLSKSGVVPDLYGVSPYRRTRQTAHFLARESFPRANWRIENLLRERDWGFGIASLDATKKEQYSQNYFMWHPTPESETFSQCQMRAEMFLLHFDRHPECKTALLVSHDEFIMSFMSLIEKDSIDEFNRKYSPGWLPNASVIQYTRQDPNTGELNQFYRWRRITCPWDLSLSKDGGQWVEFKRPIVPNADLLK
ncbi:MAG: phosphoglycerate mutase family protein [Bifidobacteriaceae bacterium]|jgi:broad specificity phosphatase PhoE|nr:phosphoglycerate mutase family protein [Bifidobacteriaceae bacterium]